MGSGKSGLYSGTHGASVMSVSAYSGTATITDRPLFLDGRVTKRSISQYREIFYGKSVSQIDAMLKKEGYNTTIRKSKHATSQAKIIVTTNPNKTRNITQVQVSPGSKRHGNVPYVKISTSNLGIIKVVDGSRSDYKTDGHETATLYFRRKSK